jgi:putative transposase
VKYRFISRQSTEFSVTVPCRVMGVSSSCFYAWRKRPAKIISADELQLYCRAKALFESSRSTLRSRTLSKKLREEGFQAGRYRTRTIMRKLRLKVQQRAAYKVTTKRKHNDRVADNLLNQNFKPLSECVNPGPGWYFTVIVDLNIPTSFTKASWHNLVFDPRWAMWVLAGTTQSSRDSLEV